MCENSLILNNRQPECKGISVIGSTGSIGKTALTVIKKRGYKVSALTAHSNLELLKRQADEFCPEIVGVTDISKENEAKKLFGKKLVLGREALTLPAAMASADTVLVSVVGISGVCAVLAAIKSGKRIALANKESLVSGGHLIRAALKEAAGSGAGAAEILPVDSEHSAVFQCLKSGARQDVDKIILTASGGAFYNYPQERLERLTPKDIFHPNWSMGRKITLDSSTMFNKALEIIEAYWLFDTDRIDYAVHPESIIHSMVRFCDGSTMAQLALPDMSLPIQYALDYPSRQACINNFEFDRPLTFLKKNSHFNAPELAMRIVEEGGRAGAVFNAAGEAASELFESGKILFTDIVKIVENYLEKAEIAEATNDRDLLEIHNDSRARVLSDFERLRR